MSRLNKTFLRSLNQMNGTENKIGFLIKLMGAILEEGEWLFLIEVKGRIVK